MSLPDKFASWKGIPREEIYWYPHIDEDKCTACGMCITTCGRNVFEFDQKNNQAIVKRPFQCMVGCTSCTVWCIFEAIDFPDPQSIKDLIIDNEILSLVKQELDQRHQRG